MCALDRACVAEAENAYNFYTYVLSPLAGAHSQPSARPRRPKKAHTGST